MDPEKFPPYNEDVIVKQLTRIFQIFTDLCYARPSDLMFPPVSTSPNDPPRHDFSQTTRKLFSDLNFSDQVISLLERTPCVCEDPSREYPMYTADTMLYPITQEDYVRPARDIVDVSIDEPRKLGANEIALAVPRNREGITMILDAEENSIRTYRALHDDDTVRLNKGRLPHPDTLGHYRNYPPYPAPTFFSKYITSLLTLEVIPCISDSCGPEFIFSPQYSFPDRPDPDLDAEFDVLNLQIAQNREQGQSMEDRRHARLKSVLTRTYGWPDNFDKERWKADCERVWEEIEEEYVPPGAGKFS